jgi:hypothetical protein
MFKTNTQFSAVFSLILAAVPIAAVLVSMFTSTVTI